MNKLLLIPFLLFISIAHAADSIEPDHSLTPGAFNVPPTPLDVLCQLGYTKQVRHVTETTKQEVLREYGYVSGKFTRSDYEIDHLIPLSLDGTNDIKNLWPESYVTTPLNAHHKDVLENTLHHLVCNKELDLVVAQQAIATDWIAAYHYVLHQDKMDLTIQ